MPVACGLDHRPSAVVRPAVQNRLIGSAWCSDTGAAAEVTAAAAAWLVRGRGWQALVYEVAWAAVVAAGARPEAMEWLVPLVEERLAARLATVRAEVEEAIGAAAREYRSCWPNDGGVDMAAELAGRDAAEQALCAIYCATVAWAGSLLLERRAATEARVSLFWRRRRPAAAAALVGEFPEPVVDRIAAPERIGWERPAAA
jgi:hypothetical protein